MKRHSLWIIAIAVISLPIASFALDLRSLTASYDIAPAEFYDPPADAKKDTLLLYIEGEAAKQIYDAMLSPATSETGDCDAPGSSTKQAGGLICRAEGQEYHCSMGVDLKTGVTRDASVC